MTKAPINLQELRRRIYRKAKSDKTHRFWELFVHVTKIETLEEAYRIAKSNGGAAGVDGQRPEGLLERIGRKDRQVKIRGARVELDGVEAALRRHPHVRDAGTLARHAIKASGAVGGMPQLKEAPTFREVSGLEAGE